MLHKAISKAVILALTTVMLLACGGDDDTDLNSFLEAPNLRLASLEVVEGGTLMLNGEVVEEFNPEFLGPYDIELTDQSLSNISLRAVAEDENVTVSIIEVRRNEDNSTEVITHEDVGGETTEVGVSVGDNTIRVRVTSADGKVISDYLLSVERVSNEAELLTAFFNQPYDSNNDNQPDQVTLFIEDEVFEYDIDVASQQCGLFFYASAVPGAVVYIDGERVESTDSTYIPLNNEGEVYPIVVDVESFDGSQNNQYTFNVTRGEATESDAERDARLVAISLNQGRESSPFRCYIDNFSQVVGNEVTSISFSAVTQRDGSTMTIGNSVLTEQGSPERGTITNVWVSENNEDLVSGEDYSGDLLSDLQEGDNYFVITVLAPNGVNLQTYLLTVRRSSASEIIVSTAAELQTALRTAEAGDGIVVLPGDYEGTPSNSDSSTGSGNPEAHFYASVDGTDENPIILYAPSGGVRLLGSDQSANTVLLISGDYWQLQGFEISEALNGVVFDGANNNQMIGMNINNVGERAVIVRNGSSNINMRTLNINSTGLLPQTRDGVSETYGEAVVVCEGELPCNGINVRNSRFGMHVANEAVDVKASAVDTSIQFNIFEFDNTIVRPVEDRTLIRLGGTNEVVSHNEVKYNDIASGEDDFAQLIKLEGSSDSVVEVFQNRFTLDEQPLTIVNNASDSQLYFGENTDIDNTDATLNVTGNSQAYVSPTYQIQSTLNSDKCLAERVVPTTFNSSNNQSVVVDLDVVAADDCANEDAQLWKIVHDSDGYVQIVSAANPENKMLIEPLGSFYLGTREDNGRTLDDAFLLRWRVLYNLDGEVSFASKSNLQSYVLEIESSNFPEEQSFTPVFVSSPFISPYFNFNLIEQQ